MGALHYGPLVHWVSCNNQMGSQKNLSDGLQSYAFMAHLMSGPLRLLDQVIDPHPWLDVGLAKSKISLIIMQSQKILFIM